MCSTCGCSGGNDVRIVDLDSGKHVHVGDDHHHHDPSADHHNSKIGSGRGPLHDHGSGRTQTILLEQEILRKNNRLAERNRGWFAARRILALNFLSSPGAGKTTLLERTIRDLGRPELVHVIEGDQETLKDAERIRATGCRVVQVNTGMACHLDAGMIEDALKELRPPDEALVFIENVGNLVCPALFDLGEQAKVVVASVTEGEEKPLKYPYIFRAATVVLLNKIDLLPYLQFDVELFRRHLAEVRPEAELLLVSATSGEGLEKWYAWLEARRGT